MKKLRWLNFLVVFSLCFLPIISFAAAAGDEREWYIGINENETFIYLLTTDEDPYEDYLETLGVFTDEEIVDIIDSMDLDDEYEAIKFYILYIKDEEVKNNGWEGVEFYFNMYLTEDRAANDWELREYNERGTIYKYTDQKYLYKHSVSPSQGLGGAFFLANDINWKELSSSVDNYFESKFVNRDVGAKRINDKGISTFRKPDTLDKSYLEKFKSKSIYNSRGILTYYEWSYDNKIITKLELEMAFFIDYWFIILIIAGVALIIVIISIKKAE